jgi:hypothetical protein
MRHGAKRKGGSGETRSSVGRHETVQVRRQSWTIAMKETITTEGSLTEPEDRVMSDGPKCVVCEQEISLSQMFDNYGTGLIVHRGCAKRAVSTHRELVDNVNRALNECECDLKGDMNTECENCRSYRSVLAKAKAGK